MEGGLFSQYFFSKLFILVCNTKLIVEFVRHMNVSDAEMYTDIRPLNYHDLVVRHTILALISQLLAHLTISHDFLEILLIHTLMQSNYVCHVI